MELIYNSSITDQIQPIGLIYYNCVTWTAHKVYYFIYMNYSKYGTKSKGDKNTLCIIVKWKLLSIYCIQMFIKGSKTVIMNTVK